MSSAFCTKYVSECYQFQVCHKITFGDGWVVLKNMFSAKDVQMATERLFSQNLGNSIEAFINTDDQEVIHNNKCMNFW